MERTREIQALGRQMEGQRERTRERERRIYRDINIEREKSINLQSEKRDIETQ